jgi:hypothetical protein
VKNPKERKKKTIEHNLQLNKCWMMKNKYELEKKGQTQEIS